MLNIKLIVSFFIINIVCFTTQAYGNDHQNEYQKFKALQAASQPVSIEVVEVSERFINACSVVADLDVVTAETAADPTSAVYRMPQECMDDQSDCSCSASTRDQICVFECTAGL